MKTPWCGSQNPESKENLAVSSSRENFKLLLYSLRMGTLVPFAGEVAQEKYNLFDLRYQKLWAFIFPREGNPFALSLLGISH